MAKINILTFHYVRNYGAVIQTYALSQYLKILGHEAEIINYTPLYFEKQFKFKLTKHPVNFIKNILSIKYFKDFIGNYLPLTRKKFTTNEDLIKGGLEAEIFIVGSDQVWNYKATQGYDKSYLLNFINTGKKIAYAVSMGQTAFPQELYQEINTLLKDFKNISVRDNFAKDYLVKDFSLKSSLAVDPTLLCNNYNILIDKDRVKEEATICYFVRSYNINNIVVKSTKELTGEKVINIGLGRIPNTSLTLNISPRDWLSWIYYSKLVITNSFHGILLSIIFKKNFIFVPNEEEQYNNRVGDLLLDLNLTERYLKNVTDLKELIALSIKYNDINLLIEAKKQESIEFLNRAMDLTT